jgi:CheY-like chemotaxis protein
MSATPVPTRTPTVLVVDDEEAIRVLMREVLEAAGYKVYEADEGFQALSILLQGRSVDIVVTDICMPRMDGYELAAHMAALSLTMPILFVTGYPTDLEGSRLTGPVLPKPFRPEQLVAGVRQAQLLRA